MFLLLTLNVFYTFPWCFCCKLWTSKCLLEWYHEWFMHYPRVNRVLLHFYCGTHFETSSEMHLEPSQTCKMALFATIINSFQRFCAFVKSSILDVWLVSQSSLFLKPVFYRGEELTEILKRGKWITFCFCLGLVECGNKIFSFPRTCFWWASHKNLSWWRVL